MRTADVVDTALASMQELVPCEELCIGLLTGDPQEIEVHARSARGEGAKSVHTIDLRPEDLERLRHADGYVLDDTSADPPSYTRPLAMRGTTSFLTLPLGGAEALAGFVCFGQATARRFEEEDIQHVRQVCDQITVALANARLVAELDEFSWGTLRALARAIDAKSPWTAGHSERVTEMALRIAKILDLSERELDTLRRGGLLHDIGKIGVAAAILDKPGRLTDEEFASMRDHVIIGASILEPLTAFADALPIVLEHHEWFNGRGYPNGLKGDELTLHGRIYAVADVFDAVTSARPYRAGMPRERAIELIKEGSGRQFDPKIVDVFLQVMAAEEVGEPTDEATSRALPAPASRDVDDGEPSAPHVAALACQRL